MYKKVLILCLTTILVIISWYGLNSAAFSQSSQFNVQADISRIESRLNRLEAQISQISRGQTPVSPSPSNSGRKQPQLSREQMFDNLATLAIETKDQVNKLQARVSKLEKLLKN
ncbi:valyl-tRNA synthetase [Synechocystis sp. PCC 7509]|uniref:valyl-tRNA synthetase n=1 Tax=Synechocystis sp. PCC 7509 TaxID=927677 RepID=UPI0002AC0BF2|nr:valyl-tRNA synthetase [Synechocystis sp. PCC 7509]